MNSIQLKTGKSYVASDMTQVVIVDQKTQAVPYPFIDSDGYLWSPDGQRPDKSQAHIFCETGDFAAIAAALPA